MLMRLMMISMLAALCCAAQPALGHRLLLMAWVQGDVLMGEAAFGDGTAGANVLITLLDGASGEKIASLHADGQGNFEYGLTKDVLNRGNPLLVRASDGAGHLAERVLDADELALARPGLAADHGTGDDPAHAFQEHVSAPDMALLQQLIQEAVRNEVAPLRREVLALSRSGPGVTEILGGIGYIIGLAGLGFWLLRKSPEDRP